MDLLSAKDFTLQELTDAYNATRVDYIVPMPMNVERLREYIRVYDVDLAHSVVMARDGRPLGLGMLGIRRSRGWITRLGVVPEGRRQGVGSELMAGLLGRAANAGLRHVWLEVIKGNDKGHNLFRHFGFFETRELIVARRAPAPDAPVSPPLPTAVKQVTALGHEEALILLAHRRERMNWLNETDTLQNVRNLSALSVELVDGSRGWVAYHAGLMQLTRIMVEVIAGEPQRTITALLQVLHQRHANQDAVIENVPDDYRWPGYEAAGYFDAFRRIEMVRTLDVARRDETE